MTTDCFWQTLISSRQSPFKKQGKAFIIIIELPTPDFVQSHHNDNNNNNNNNNNDNNKNNNNIPSQWLTFFGELFEIDVVQEVEVHSFMETM